jgi:predicted nucleic acid-binding OB-fold protein
MFDGISGEPVVPREANRIIIPFFHNYTAEPSVAEKLTLRLRQIIGMDGRLAVVANNENADLRLAGAVVQYQVQPVQYGNFNEPVRKRLRIISSIRLFNLKTGREILYDGEIQAFQLFSELIPPVTSEIQVQEAVIENLARRISVKTVEGWYTGLMTPAEKGKR